MAPRHGSTFLRFALSCVLLAACSASGGTGLLPPPGDVPDDRAAPPDAAPDATADDRTAPTDTVAPGDTATPQDAPADAPAGDAAVPTDAADAGGDAPSGPPVAWGMPCDERSACQGENAYCGLGLGRPVCLHGCNAQAAWSLCESGRGVCVPLGDEKVCLKRCGDGDRAVCDPGSSCQFVAYRDNSATDAGFPSVGVCLADCAASGADACMAAGRVCTPTTRSCARPACPAGCAVGATCMNGECVPSPAIPLYGTCRAATGAATNGCREELCLGDARGGFCTAVCNSENDATCGAEGVCWSGNLQAAAAMGTSLPERLVASTPGRFDAVGGRSRGVCLKPCAESGDCPAGFHCGNYNGRRVCMPYSLASPSPAPGVGLPGSVCAEDAQCVTGRCVPYTAAGRWGFCARASTAVPCPAGTAADATVPLACIPTCTGERGGECPAPLHCFGARPGTAGQCLPAPCRESSDCRAGNACNPQSGRCEPMPFRAGAAVGSACTSDGAACASGQCLTMSGATALPGGYCTLTCVTYGDNSDSCPAGSICNTNVVGVGSVCLDLCDNAGASRYGACRTGYVCQPFNGDRRFGICLPR